MPYLSLPVAVMMAVTVIVAILGAVYGLNAEIIPAIVYSTLMMGVGATASAIAFRWDMQRAYDREAAMFDREAARYAEADRLFCESPEGKEYHAGWDKVDAAGGWSNLSKGVNSK